MVTPVEARREILEAAEQGYDGLKLSVPVDTVVDVSGLTLPDGTETYHSIAPLLLVPESRVREERSRYLVGLTPRGMVVSFVPPIPTVGGGIINRATIPYDLITIVRQVKEIPSSAPAADEERLEARVNPWKGMVVGCMPPDA